MQLHTSQPNQLSISKLTRRETQILYLMAIEKCASEIAQELEIGESTVKSHRKNIYIKLDVCKTAGAVRKGFEHGYLKFA